MSCKATSSGRAVKERRVQDASMHDCGMKRRAAGNHAGLLATSPLPMILPALCESEPDKITVSSLKFSHYPAAAGVAFRASSKGLVKQVRNLVFVLPKKRNISTRGA